MFEIFQETPSDGPDIEFLFDLRFGLDRADKTVYRLREGIRPLTELCFLARSGHGLAGAIRFWPIQVSGPSPMPLLLLGPLAVMPKLAGRGIGQALVQNGLARARRHGHRAVLLVGDPDYYQKFGFEAGPASRLRLPGPNAPKRLLALELRPNALARVSGLVDKPRRCLRRAA